MIVNQTILDQYLVQVHNCYQSIIIAMENDMMQSEASLIRRLEVLEEKDTVSLMEIAVISLAIIASFSCLVIFFVVCRKCCKSNTTSDDRDKPMSIVDHHHQSWNPYNSIARSNNFISEASPGEPDRSAGVQNSWSSPPQYHQS